MPPIISRGFRGRRRDAARPTASRPASTSTHDFPVLSAGPTPHTPLDAVGLHDRRRGRRAAPLDLGGVPRAAERGGHGRHPLRDEVVEARHRPGRASPSTRCSTASRPRPSTSSPSATAATRRTCRSRTSPTARRGSPTPTTASRSSPSTAARRGCSSRTSTSGRARSGCAASGCTRRTSPASGRSNGYHIYGDPWQEQRYWGD